MNRETLNIDGCDSALQCLFIQLSLKLILNDCIVH